MSAKSWRLEWSERIGKQVRGTEVEIRERSVQGSLYSDQFKVIMTLQFYSILTFFIFDMLFLMGSFSQFVLMLKLPLEKFYGCHAVCIVMFVLSQSCVVFLNKSCFGSLSSSAYLNPSRTLRYDLDLLTFWNLN